MPLTVDLPENLEQAVGLSRAELGDQVKLMAALKMFELGKISAGKAAELADLSRAEFIHACHLYRVSLFNYPPETMEAELRAELEAASGGAQHRR